MNEPIIRSALERLLQTDIRSLREVKGGDIGLSLYADTGMNEYFVKFRKDLSADVFECEADGLEALRRAEAADGLAVPRTYYAGPIPGQASGGMIVLEWIEAGRTTSVVEERLATGLGALHRIEPAEGRFGLARHNYIGTLPQLNGWSSSWVEFYRDRRLMPMVRLADDKRLLSTRRRAKLGRLMESLDRFIPDTSRPGLLHGDLWSGNWLAGLDGKPYLIDPAEFYGEREYELAFTELFGGFSKRFYAAYQEVCPLAHGYEDRRPLYQLYYLLVHLIHFGEAYGPSVDRLLDRYV